MMGLMDRDNMQEKDRQRPFSPPPERWGTLGKVLISLVVLFLIYLATDWKLNQQANNKADKGPASAGQTQRVATAPSLQGAPAEATTSNAAGNTRTVTKCVVNGKTSYGDESCARGAITSQVTTRADHNLMAAVRPQPAPRSEAPLIQETVVTQQSDAVETKKFECARIDAEIKHLDAMARQPQSGQTQDWIAAERKKLRDRQFRIPCQ